MTTVKSLVLAIGAVSLTSAAVHGNSTGQLELTGSMPLECSLSLLGSDSLRQNIDLNLGSGERTVGEILEHCNDPDGYTVTMESENGTSEGLFTSATLLGIYSQGDTIDDNHAGIKYDIQYGNNGTFGSQSGSTAMTSGSVVVTDSDEPVTARTQQAYKVTIKYKNPDQAPAGDYTDTLTFTIAAK